MEEHDDSSRDSMSSAEVEFQNMLAKKRREMRKHEKEAAIKSMKALLKVSEKYSSFCKEKIGLVDSNSASSKNDKKKALLDTELTLKYFKNGKLHPYQNDGVSWLIMLFNYGLSGILADEMGLGKTVQIIAFICHLVEKQAKGPFLIVVPLSTLPNWRSEFQRFAPDLPVITLYGNMNARRAIKPKITKEKVLGNVKVRPVVLVTYQGVSQEVNFLSSIKWKYLIIDEGQRIKNHLTRLSLDLKEIPTLNKLLLTGTPLQNNIKELWSLLNFLMPMLFNEVDTFQALLALEDMEDNQRIVEEEQSCNIISSIHQVLRPFMLRRLKKDVLEDIVPKKELNVYCHLTPLQVELYKYSIDLTIKRKETKLDPYEEIKLDGDVNLAKKRRKCLSLFNEKAEAAVPYEDTQIGVFKYKHKLLHGVELDDNLVQFYHKTYMKNFWTTQKEIAMHPFCVHHPEDPPDSGLLVNGEELIKNSGKMMALDKLLPKLKERGHKVLLFSTFVMMLDIVQDYLEYKNFNYCRLDGRHDLEMREQSIKSFNEDKDVFIFLVSTRAGGLGLNLTAADTVIFFDRDWNPQVDNQAKDRCHRIGQTKPVVIYSLTSKNTIDETILKCGVMKKRLEKLIIKEGKFNLLKSDEDGILTVQEMKEMLNQISNEEEIVTDTLTDEVLEKLLDRSDLYEQMESSKNSHKSN